MVLLVYNEETDLYIPACFVLCSSKNKDIYLKIFRDILNNILQRSYNIRRMTVDFETAQIEAIQETFPEIELIGCRFHFKQALIRKAKKLGLLNSDLEKLTNEMHYEIYAIIENGIVNFENYLETLQN